MEPVLGHQQEREPELREPREWVALVQELQKAQVGPVLGHQQEREPRQWVALVPGTELLGRGF